MTISLTVAAQNLRAKIRSTPIILNLTELNAATAAAEAAALAAAASEAAAAASAVGADSSETDAETAQAASEAAAAAAAASVASIDNATIIRSTGVVDFAANQAMGGFKLTGLAAATANGDALRFEQLGAASATDNAAVRFDGTGGKSMQDSALVIADTTAALSRTGAGGIAIQGTNTNDSAAAGNVGETVESTVLSGAGVSLVNATSKTVTSVSLTAGDWLVWGNVGFSPAGTTTMSALNAAINTVTDTLPTAPGAGSFTNLSLTFTTGGGQILQAGQRRVSLSSTTSVFLIANASFGVSTMTAYGYIGARRVR